MPSYQEVLKKIEEYEINFRKEDLEPFERSDIYTLFPDSTKDNGLNIVGKWPDTWPNSDRQGVYLILGEDLNVLYVGKASMSNLGKRLSSYFKYEKDGSCKVTHSNWSQPPRYVATIAVPKNMPFEAAALEEFLIREFDFADNTIGT